MKPKCSELDKMHVFHTYVVQFQFEFVLQLEFQLKKK